MKKLALGIIIGVAVITTCGFRFRTDPGGFHFGIFTDLQLKTVDGHQYVVGLSAYDGKSENYGVSMAMLHHAGCPCHKVNASNPAK